MKLRYDLARLVTPEMVLEEALVLQHRFQTEPRFSQTGTGSLSPASTGDSAAEAARSTARIQKLMQLASPNGKPAEPSNGTS